MTCLTRYQNKKGMKIHVQGKREYSALAKAVWAGWAWGPDPAHSPFYLYTRLDLALSTFLVCIKVVKITS